MYNHARTMLANQASFNGSASYLAEEATPTDFVPLKAVPGYLTVVRSLLFGSKPDRHMVNYRCRQFVRLIHATPLVDYVFQLDPRVTYSLTDAALVPAAAFMPVVMQLQGVPTTLYVQGVPTAPDTTGQIETTVEVRVAGPTSVQVQEITPTSRSQFLPFALTDGLSDAVPLGQSGYSVRLTTTSPGMAWDVVVRNRPQADLADLLASLTNIGEPNLNALFGITAEQPYLTFRNLWKNQKELPLRLSALLMAVVYRMDQAWRAERGTN